MAILNNLNTTSVHNNGILPRCVFSFFSFFFLHILKARFFCQASHKMQRDDDKWDCLSTPSRFDESWIHTFYSCGTLFNLVAKPLTTSTNLYQAVGTEGVKGGYLPPPPYFGRSLKHIPVGMQVMPTTSILTPLPIQVFRPLRRLCVRSTVVVRNL